MTSHHMMIHCTRILTPVGWIPCNIDWQTILLWKYVPDKIALCLWIFVTRMDDGWLYQYCSLKPLVMFTVCLHQTQHTHVPYVSTVYWSWCWWTVANCQILESVVSRVFILILLTLAGYYTGFTRILASYRSIVSSYSLKISFTQWYVIQWNTIPSISQTVLATIILIMARTAGMTRDLRLTIQKTTLLISQGSTIL